MSYKVGSVWERLASQPVFVLTSDQDWAPEWAIQRLLETPALAEIPLHVFRTNPSPILDAAVRGGRIEDGWHPNFMHGSSHGATIPEVIEYCRKHFPGARTVRTHCHAEDTFRWQALAAAGIIADSQYAALFQAGLLPLVHFTGIVRLPVYFSDDALYQLAAGSLALDVVRPTLFTPGLKILNFHPTFVACNTPSRMHHDRYRAQIFGSASPGPGVIYEGRGTAHVFRELLDLILSAGHHFVRFDELAEQCVQHVRRSPELSAAPLFFGPSTTGSEWFRKSPF